MREETVPSSLATSFFDRGSADRSRPVVFLLAPRLSSLASCTPLTLTVMVDGTRLLHVPLTSREAAPVVKPSFGQSMEITDDLSR
ncbi:MAG: hypothetical protein WBX15_04025 [Thermoanaerobaculia bacterium]